MPNRQHAPIGQEFPNGGVEQLFVLSLRANWKASAVNGSGNAT